MTSKWFQSRNKIDKELVFVRAEIIVAHNLENQMFATGIFDDLFDLNIASMAVIDIDPTIENYRCSFIQCVSGQFNFRFKFTS